MDELCKMLAENIGIALDSTSEWLVGAVGQYATMSAIGNGYEILSALVVLSVAAMFAYSSAKKVDEISKDDKIFKWKREEMCGQHYIIVVLLSVVMLVAVIYLIYAADELLKWLVCPDAMLLQELIKQVG